MAGPTMNGLLIRMPVPTGADGKAANASLNLDGSEVTLQPLFTVPGRPTGMGLARTERQWFRAKADSLKGGSPWDIAHEAGRSLSLAGTRADFIEPDIEEPWPARESESQAAGGFKPQKPTLPPANAAFAWHLSDQHSQLGAARKAVGMPNGHGTVRVMHLDTGYDPNHVVFQGLSIEGPFERNFIDGDGNGSGKGSAVDRDKHGLGLNPGHGTGTLGILAGQMVDINQDGYRFKDLLGGVPFARIIPVRVGNSVIQLKTSSVAGAIDYAATLCYNDSTRVHVLSMSMGGVASEAWANAVNKAYDAGVVLVTAAGNNFAAGPFDIPTRFIVYPARFGRVIAACGVMADGRPYYTLPPGTMQGNWGPDNKMHTAMAAYTPNTPWARMGSTSIVDMDGAGTSSATPQIAAAAALYVQNHFDELNRLSKPWMRVEAVRAALFERAADGDPHFRAMLGRGILRARDSLNQPVPSASELERRRTPEDSARFSFWRVITGLGLASSSTRHRMLELEALQLVQRWTRTDAPNPVDFAVPLIDAQGITAKQATKFFEALSQHPDASKTLKGFAKSKLDGSAQPKSGPPSPKAPAGSGGTSPTISARTRTFTPPSPPYRCIRGYATDPTLAGTLDTVSVSEVMFKVPWEELEPGPKGKYVEVIDVDPASDCVYEPVNLDDPMLLAQDGLPSSEGTPQFHQQMSYAVASLTIKNFEEALGRWSLWRPGPAPDGVPEGEGPFVERLRIHPHALREANAFYSPQKNALLMGYFASDARNAGGHLPSSVVFTCLSHDILAHETTHALLDGMHRNFLLPSNPDVHAFHEAFADIVALFQRFTFPEVLRHQIARTRGNIRSQHSILGTLASQFGRAQGHRGGLREAIGTIDEHGKWIPHEAKPNEYLEADEPHKRGSFLVAAIFDAFLSIYDRRTADLVRLSSHGTGILEAGAIHPDLVERLAGEAQKAAQHVLTMCIRALDYCPPTDITFGEYLRAIITADQDLVPDDDLNYRVAFVEAFRKRGIYPRDIRTLSIESLLWHGPEHSTPPPSDTLRQGLGEVRKYASKFMYAKDRRAVFDVERELRGEIHDWLKQHLLHKDTSPNDAAFLGLDPSQEFKVHTARIALRARPDGGVMPRLIVGVLQEAMVPEDPRRPNGDQMLWEGGSTIIADLKNMDIKYCISKNTKSKARRKRQSEFAMNLRQTSRSTYFGSRLMLGEVSNEAFALLHRGI